MGKRGTVKYQLTESYTRRGCHSFAAQLLQSVTRVWLLKGPAVNNQVEFIKNLGENLASRGYEVEFWLSALLPGGAQGVHFPQLDAAVIGEALVNSNLAASPGIVVVELEEAPQPTKGDAREQELALWQARLLDYKRHVEDLIENSLYMEQYLDQEGTQGSLEERVDNLSRRVQEMIFNRRPLEKHFYAASLTLDGLMDYVQEITGQCRTRYILHGKTGSGQSQLLEQAAAKALSLGWEVDYYHWALDPKRVCLILIPAANSALMDNSCLAISPQAGDVVIKMNGLVEQANGDDNPGRSLDTLLLRVQADLDQVDRAQREINRLLAGESDPVRLVRQREKLEHEILQY